MSKSKFLEQEKEKRNSYKTKEKQIEQSKKDIYAQIERERSLRNQRKNARILDNRNNIEKTKITSQMRAMQIIRKQKLKLINYLEKHSKINPKVVESEKTKELLELINKNDMKLQQEGSLKVVNYLDTF